MSVEQEPPEVRLLRLAARRVRGGAEIGPEAREALATWLDAEAAVRAEMEPFAEVINAAVRHKTGVESYIRFGRGEDGQPVMHLDTIEGALALAAALAVGGAS
jgi:hypothetical protein